jgi:MoaA/NifB/PqqE/SkfB family radical SAM enzyme|tara:strand:+ start:719 stop:1591 length:873 start_codon:yes stop_codon:yes gene_type:complete
MFKKTKWLHVEPTTRCNAWCSSCPRNVNGYGLAKNFALEDLDPARLEQVIEKLPNLTTVQFCGNLGDPCASKLIDKQLKIVKDSDLELQIHTNGSLRSAEWWHDLAKLFGAKLTVRFAIDGLEDTHKIYRQATDWNKIIENAKTFIDAGGNAIWQFIPFAHNEHQIKDCMKLSTKLGFSKFEFVKDARYFDKAYDYRSGEPVDIRPWSEHNTQWIRKGEILNKKTGNKITKKIVEKKNCMHLALSSLFLNASGVIAPCCYFGQTPAVEGQIEHSINTKNYIDTCISACGS